MRDMKLLTQRYLDQREAWPKSGRHILAQYDDTSVVVYQAYRHAIGDFARQHGYFGGEFSLGRMSWIKPNFLWMMYRSGWATKPGQEVVLAIRLKRSAFDEIVARAVHSSYVAEVYASREDWKEQVKHSDVRLQWDPDHAPDGAKEVRRAIQIGLRGDSLLRFSREWILEIEDISSFVREQQKNIRGGKILFLPKEQVYPVQSATTRAHLGLSDVGEVLSGNS